MANNLAGSPPPCPTPVECHLHERVERDGRVFVACYWPEAQDGETGLARAWISPRTENEVVDPPRDFDAWVWREGETEPRSIVGCSSEDFVAFAAWLSSTVGRSRRPARERS